MRNSNYGVRVILLVMLLCFGLSRIAAAQLATGTIAGTVQDASGAVVPGVTVHISNPGTIGGNQQTITNERGAYQFTRLVPSNYSVRAELAGFRSSVRENVAVNADVTARVDFSLAVGEVSETVSVSGEAPLLDTTTALNQSVLERLALDTLPSGNDLWSIGRMVPGVLVSKYDVGGSESFTQTIPSIHGSPQNENKYAIDGMDVAWPGDTAGRVMVYFDTSMFQEINYQTGAISAENSQGGVVMNMVTKTGTNDFHGSFMFVGSNSRLQSNNITPELRRDLLAAVPARVFQLNPNVDPKSKILSIFDTGMTISGPLDRDKLWFTLSGKVNALYQLVLGSYNTNGTQGVDDNRIVNGSTKISWQANVNNQLHFTYSRNMKYVYHRRVGTFSDENASQVQDQPADIYQIKWASTLSPKLILDAGVSLQTGVSPYHEQKAVKPGDLPRFDSGTQTATVAAGVYRREPEYKGVASASISYFAGKHDVKTGYQFSRNMHRRISWSTSHYPSGLRAVYVNGRPDSVTVYNSPTDFKGYWMESAGYIQDKWTPTRKLTLNLGLRLQHTSGWVPPQCQAASIFIVGECFAKIPNVPNWTDLVPRFGLSYDVFGTGKTALKLAANRYTIGVGSAQQFRVNPISEATETRPWTDSNSDLIPQLNELGQGTGFNFARYHHYNPDLKRPMSNEYSIEIEHQLLRNIVVTIGYFHRETRRNVGSKNLAVPRDSYVPLQVREVTSGQNVTVYNQSAATRGRFDVLWDNFSELDSSFNGMDLSFNKRLSERWMLMGGLSIGKNRGDTYGADSELNNPNFTFRRGPVGSDVPVSFKASGIYQLPLGVTVSGTAQHFSGFPENTTVNVTGATVPLTQVTQSLRIEERGTSRLPDNNIIDLSLRKSIRIGESFSTEPTLDIFNLTNANTIQGRVTQMGTTFGRVSSILRGRLWRLGFNLKF